MKYMLLMTALLAGCVTAPQHEKQAAFDNLFDCFEVNAKKLDDRTSDARSIGRTVAGLCMVEGNAAVEVATRGRDGFFKSGYMSGFGPQMVDWATQAVLEARTARR